MSPANNFIVLNIREYLENEELGEGKLVQLLSEFSCPLNPDVELFFETTVNRICKEASGSYLFGIVIRRRSVAWIFFNYNKTSCC